MVVEYLDNHVFQKHKIMYFYTALSIIFVKYELDIDMDMMSIK